MLFILVLLFCSTSAVLVDDTMKLNSFNPLLPQVNYQPDIQIMKMPGFQLENNQARVVSGIANPSSYVNCPANKVLQKIEVILLKALNDEYDRNLASNQHNDINTLTSQAEKLVVPLAKINSLKDLLGNNNLQKKLRTKVTVKYELPSIEDLTCKQALNQILEVLRESKFMHNYYRTCSPHEKCARDNIVDIKNEGNNNVLNTAINQGNNPAPNKLATLDTDLLSYKLNDGSDSKQDLNSLLKYLLTNKGKEVMALLQNYRTSEQMNLLNDTVSKDLLEKLNIHSQSVSDGIKNLPDNNRFIYQQILNPPQETITQNTNISDIIAQALLHETKTPVKTDQDADKTHDKFIATGANDKNIISYLPAEKGKNIQIDFSNGQKPITNIDTGLPVTDVLTGNSNIQNQQSITNILGGVSDNLNGNAQNVSNNIMSVLNPGNTGVDYNKFVNSVLQYQVNNQQTQPQQAIYGKNQGPPYYVNGNLVMNGGNYLSPNEYLTGSVYQRPYQTGSSYNAYYTYNGNPNRFPNLNLLNNNPQLLNHQKMLYQTSYGKMNPFLGNPTVSNNVKQIGQQLYAPHNLANPQRLSGVTDQTKLNFATDNNGIVELTYMLKQPNPVVYQPVYFVKYRLPYYSFVNNLKEMLKNKPHLRNDPKKLYQELISVSKIAEVSPSLKGVGEEKLTQMVTTNGALVKTKVLKVNETLLDKQLQTVQNLNSILAPNEIVNVTYSVQVNANKQADKTKKSDVRSGVVDPDDIDIKYIEDILNHDKTLAKDLDTVSTVPPYTKPAQDYEIKDMATFR